MCFNRGHLLDSFFFFFQTFMKKTFDNLVSLTEEILVPYKNYNYVRTKHLSDTARHNNTIHRSLMLGKLGYFN